MNQFSKPSVILWYSFWITWSYLFSSRKAWYFLSLSLSVRFYRLITSVPDFHNKPFLAFLQITPNRSKRVVRKGSFRRQFIQAADVLDDEISKFIVQNNIDAHAGELHGGEQFRLIDRFYPERMKTIYDLHVFRNQNHGRHKEWTDKK